jgi:hypothetical protein
MIEEKNETAIPSTVSKFTLKNKIILLTTIRPTKIMNPKN